ncbi:MAG: anti-sigma factor [Sphingobacteriales bacterium]|nr:MAG: anti-sigma factor [Sphingobacteriales bacterium]
MSPDLYISSGILELYVAGVLSPAEMEEVTAMAAKHDRIREEIQRIEETHLQYAASHAPAGLSRHFFDDILTKIDELPEEVPQPQTKSKAVNKEREKPQPAPKTIKLKDDNSRREGRRSPARFYMVIAASLILFALSALLNLYLYQQWQSTQNDLVALQSENTAISQQYNQVKLEKDKAFSEFAIYGNPDYKRVKLSGLPIASQSEAMIYWNKNTQDVFLQVMNLPQAPAGKQYQLWAIDETDKPVDAGMLASLDNNISPMKKIGSAKAFAITLEPTGGSQNPTMEAMYVMGNI